MLIQSCVTLTKTMRDMHESGQFVNRIEDAKAERLLMEVSNRAPRNGTGEGGRRVLWPAACLGSQSARVIERCPMKSTHIPVLGPMRSRSGRMAAIRRTAMLASR